ncbi:MULTISPECIES: hypothetical protein [Paenibacillus]|uniref:hypothetical protein n=1 Tax=Paenibacillus TaxID=44249 RepID=UPI00073F5C2C|nr:MULTISPECIES: hypothetical protein [Paenibacillus]MDU4694314.1 hypothetical protein [Paenibacillus sp.]
MRGYNLWRPIFLILIALLTNSLVSNLCILFGMTPEAAKNIGFVAMMLAALVVYTRFSKNRRK